MKNTSLFVSFWAMPKRKPSVEPSETNGLSVTLTLGVIGDTEWCPLIAFHCIISKSELFSSLSLPPCSFIAKVTQLYFGVVVIYALLC